MNVALIEKSSSKFYVVIFVSFLIFCFFLKTMIFYFSSLLLSGHFSNEFSEIVKLFLIPFNSLLSKNHFDVSLGYFISSSLRNRSSALKFNNKIDEILINFKNLL